MAKYVYIVSPCDSSIWVKDGHFEMITDARPQDYPVSHSSLKSAKEALGKRAAHIYKFEAKQPYVFVGEVK